MNRDARPVEWALFLYELEDAQEHLLDLIQSLTTSGTVDEFDLRIRLGHVYAHLNRAWHSRSLPGDVNEEVWEQFSRFPDDLEPVG